MGLASFLLTIQIPLPSSLFSRGDMAMVAFAGGTLGCKAVVGCEEYPQELCKDVPGLNGPIWSVCAVDISQFSYFSKLITDQDRVTVWIWEDKQFRIICHLQAGCLKKAGCSLAHFCSCSKSLRPHEEVGLSSGPRIVPRIREL